jgi:hypothetical protein
MLTSGEPEQARVCNVPATIQQKQVAMAYGQLMTYTEANVNNVPRSAMVGLQVKC